MEKHFNDAKRNYIQFEAFKTEKTKQEIAKKLLNSEKNRVPHPEISSINKFIENRKRHNQDRREASLSKLEKLGVKFSIEQRSKDLIVREKEKIMSNYLIKNL